MTSLFANVEEERFQYLMQQVLTELPSETMYEMANNSSAVMEKNGVKKHLSRNEENNVSLAFQLSKLVDAAVAESALATQEVRAMKGKPGPSPPSPIPNSLEAIRNEAEDIKELWKTLIASTVECRCGILCSFEANQSTSSKCDCCSLLFSVLNKTICVWKKWEEQLNNFRKLDRTLDRSAAAKGKWNALCTVVKEGFDVCVHDLISMLLQKNALDLLLNVSLIPDEGRCRLLGIAYLLLLPWAFELLQAMLPTTQSPTKNANSTYSLVSLEQRSAVDFISFAWWCLYSLPLRSEEEDVGLRVSASLNSLLTPFFEWYVKPAEKVVHFHFSNIAVTVEGDMKVKNDTPELLSPQFFFDVWKEELTGYHLRRKRLHSAVKKLAALLPSQNIFPYPLDDVLSFGIDVLFSLGVRLLTRRVTSCLLSYYRWESLVVEAIHERDERKKSEKNSEKVDVVLRILHEGLRFLSTQPFQEGSPSYSTDYTLYVLFPIEPVRWLWADHLVALASPLPKSGVRKHFDGSAESVLRPPRSTRLRLFGKHLNSSVEGMEDSNDRQRLLLPALRIRKVIGSGILSLVSRSGLLHAASEELRVADWGEVLWERVIEPTFDAFLQLAMGHSSGAPAATLDEWEGDEVHADILLDESFLMGPVYPFHHQNLIQRYITAMHEAHLSPGERSQENTTAVCYQSAWWRAARTIWTELESLQVLLDSAKEWRAVLGEDPVAAEEPSHGKGDESKPFVRRRGAVHWLHCQYVYAQTELLRLCDRGVAECFRRSHNALACFSALSSDAAAERINLRLATSADEVAQPLQSILDINTSLDDIPRLPGGPCGAWVALEDFLRDGRAATGFGSLFSRASATTDLAPLLSPHMWAEVELRIQKRVAEQLEKTLTSTGELNELKAFLQSIGCTNAASFLLATN